jgi:hypothetical protein
MHYTKGCCKWLHWLWQEFGVGWINENHSKLHWNYVYDVMSKIILHYVELIEITVSIVFESFVTKKYTCEWIYKKRMNYKHKAKWECKKTKRKSEWKWEGETSLKKIDLCDSTIET